MIRPLTVAGAAQVRWAVVSLDLLLPVELRRVNHAASTNERILTTDFTQPVPASACWPRGQSASRGPGLLL